MSLLRLLSAGKSLVGLKDSSGRYNLANHRMLPRFEPKKNPFRGGVEAGPLAEPCASEAPAANLESAQKQTEQPQPSRQNALPKQTKTPVRNPFAKLATVLGLRRAGSNRQSPGRPGNGLVQAELSLDSVKVVRNDLRDSDLEIVTAPPSATPKAQKQNLNEVTPALPSSGGDTVAPAQDNPDAAIQTQNKSSKGAANFVGRLFGVSKT